jgi:NAD+ diphosphatase
MEFHDLALGRAAANRHAHKRDDAQWWEQTRAVARIVITIDGQIPMRNGGIDFLSAVETRELELAYLGEFEGIEYAAVIQPTHQHQWPEDLDWQSLRTVGKDLDDLHAGLATTSVALWQWHKSNTHCSRCGSQTFVTNAGWVRQCPTDGSQHFPRMDNAVIVSVIDSTDRLLLARQTIWAENHYSVVAGFVEPGEVLEAAVVREVLEETGVHITEPRILGNQPWPFPASMMLAFTARAITTDITVDGVEIAHARFFSRDELAAACNAGEVQIPTRTSIARRLIDHWYGEPTPDEWTRN